MKDIKNFIL